jgi:apolipoprotein N-acyltransferase
MKRSFGYAVAAMLVSGTCWWLSFSLGLHWWWPIWLAPVPILWLAPRLTGWATFGLGFTAFLSGRLAWLGYLLSLMPVMPAVLITLIPPLLFGLALLPARAFLRRGQPVMAAVSFGALWAAMEFLSFVLGKDGTFGSIAYTQAGFLPGIQLAALTGVEGISFVLCFIPALAAAALYFRRGWLLLTGFIVLVVGFGWVRLQTGRYGAPVRVGLVSLGEAVYGGRIYETNAAKEMEILRKYSSEIKKMTDAIVVVLPEKALPVTDTTEAMVRDSLQRLASKCGVVIVGGVTRIGPKRLANLAPVFGTFGTMLFIYEKVHLFEGEAIEGFSHGSSPGIYGGIGVAICKDLDFAPYMRRYAQAGIRVLYAPAWDFVRDGWWHSRIAIVGAVANGYALVRNAREGRLTISDDRGRVSFEASSEGRELTTMIGTVRPAMGRTLYSRWGDWFGWLMVGTALALLVYLAARRSFTRV